MEVELFGPWTGYMVGISLSAVLIVLYLHARDRQDDLEDTIDILKEKINKLEFEREKKNGNH